MDSQLQTLVDASDLQGAMDIIEQAHSQGFVQPRHYRQVFRILESDVVPDFASLSRIARWFTSSQPVHLNATTPEELSVWKSAIKACFKLGRSHFSRDLSGLLQAFTSRATLNEVADPDLWGIVLRGYGILKQEDMIDAMIAKIPTDVDCQDYVPLAYASAGAHGKTDESLDRLIGLRIPKPEVFKILSKTAAHEGDVERVKSIASKGTELLEGVHFEQDIVLAHKTRLFHLLKKQNPSTSYSGRNNSGVLSEELKESRRECEELISNMLSDRYPLDISSANIILDYLTFGNRLDHVKFPMSHARDILEKVLPTKGIQPNFQSYFLVLRGYAKTRELDSPRHNARLDKCLELFYMMENAGFHSHQHAKFQCLFEACLPHSDRYNYDLFQSKSRLAPTLQSSIARHNTPFVDPRIFDIERIMLDSNIRHDRITIKTVLTCLGVSGLYGAMWRRWKELQLAGVRRDGGLFQRIFSLAALEPEQAQYALAVVYHQLERETPKIDMTMPLYRSIIDCCITAQDAVSATSVLRTAGIDNLPSNEEISNPQEKQMKKLGLKAQLGIRSLTGSIGTHLKDMMDLRVSPKSDMWLMLMSHAVETHFSLQDAQRVFNGFTMSRFEQTGKIPVPAHEQSPIIPFPSSPYNETDVLMIDMFVSALLKSQNIPVIRDVLETYAEQSSKIWLSRDSVKQFVTLAKGEKSDDDVKWIVEKILPKLSNQSSNYKHWMRKLQRSVDNL
ncbi:unnamed protein product [Umbelopsis ramanniana]